MSRTEPNPAETKRVIYADSASTAQELLSRCLTSVYSTGGQMVSAASAADLRHALATDTAAVGIVLTAPIEAFLESVLEGLGVEQALNEMRSTMNTLKKCVRDYRQRLVLIDLSHASPAPYTLADTLDLPQENLDGYSRGDPDPVLRALAAQAMAEDTACCTAIEFLEASSAVPPDSTSSEAAEAAFRAYLSVKQNASDAAALRAEVLRREAGANRDFRQILALKKEIGDLESKAQIAGARAEAAEKQISHTQSQFEQSEARVAELSHKLAKRDAKIQRIRSTWTFRATKPIRRIGTSLGKMRHG